MLIIFCGFASIFEVVEPLESLCTAFIIYLKDSFNHVKSFGSCSLTFCSIFDTQFLFCALRHHKYDA